MSNQTVIEAPVQLDIGYAADQLQRLSIKRPDLEIRISNGQIRIGRVKVTWDNCPIRIGTLGCELTADNWNTAALSGSGLIKTNERY